MVFGLMYKYIEFQACLYLSVLVLAPIHFLMSKIEQVSVFWLIYCNGFFNL